MAQQTSVEWLVEELSSKHIGFEIYVNANKETIEQAKEMHEKENKTAFDAGMNSSADYFYPTSNKTEAENYYNETFKNENSRTSN